jgi:uncharacterized membrane protein
LYFAPEEITHLTFFLNIQFFTTLAVCASLAAITFLATRKSYPAPFQDEAINNLIQYGIGVAVAAVLYFGIYMEVQHYWDQRYAENAVWTSSEYGDRYQQYDDDLLSFKTLWLIYFSAIFAAIGSLIQIRFLKDKYTMIGCLVFNALVVATFLTMGLYELSVLRSSYLFDSNNQYFYREGNIAVRYLGIVLMIPLLLINMRFMKSEIFDQRFRIAEKLLLHLAILILLSSELVHWLDMALVENSFKLGLSILWGTYALFLIVLGLWKNLGYLRIAAIVLFGVTLVKLFLYDMADMSTIARTIVMIVLGVLLLVASFLYNKNKKTVENEVQ